MKKPSLKNLRIDEPETNRIKAAMAHHRSIKITININADTLEKLKALAQETGVPYQRLINRTLTDGLASSSGLNLQSGNSRMDNSRLDRIERDLAMLKRKIAA